MPHKTPEARRAYQMAYSRKHSLLKTARAAVYNQTHLDVRRATVRRWNLAHPESRLKNKTLRRQRETPRELAENVSRAVVFKRDGGVCGICTQPVDPANWHLDHVVPLARGGAHSYANTQVSHPACNMQKGVHFA